MHFFNNEIILIRESIQCSTDSSSATGIIEVVISPGVCLESFHLIDLQELTTTLSSSKLSTCILHPIHTRLLQEVLTGYASQSFKLAVIKPLLKNLP